MELDILLECVVPFIVCTACCDVLLRKCCAVIYYHNLDFPCLGMSRILSIYVNVTRVLLLFFRFDFQFYFDLCFPY